jgi:hypothetical protein
MDGCQHACPLACPPACLPACPVPLLQRPRGVQYAASGTIIIIIRFLFSFWVNLSSCVSHTSGILYFWGHVSVCYICRAVRGQLWSTHRRAASLEAGPASTIFDGILLGRGMNGKEQSGEPTTYQTVAA